MSAEIRIDQLSGMRTILAPGRADRPEGFVAPTHTPKGPEGCPFCEGREERTPPELYAVRPGGGEAHGPGWLVRVFPTSTRRSPRPGRRRRRPGAPRSRRRAPSRP